MSDTYNAFEAEFHDYIQEVQQKAEAADWSSHNVILALKKDLHQAEKALKQMEVEVAMMPPPLKAKHTAALKKHRHDWQSLIKVVKSHEKQFYQESSDSLSSVGSNQLLSQNAQLQHGLQEIASTELVAVSTVGELKKQRNQIESITTNNRDLGSGLISSSNIMDSMKRRACVNKFLIISAVFLLLVTISIILYKNIAG